MITLAELPAPESPQSVGWLVLTVFAFAGGAYYVIGCWEKITGKSRHRKIQEPLEVRAASDFATTAQHEKLEKKFENETAKQAASRKGIYERLDEHSGRIAAMERRAESIEKLEEKIDNNTSLTAETRGELKQINQNVSQLQTSLAQFLQAQAKR